MLELTTKKKVYKNRPCPIDHVKKEKCEKKEVTKQIIIYRFHMIWSPLARLVQLCGAVRLSFRTTLDSILMKLIECNNRLKTVE